MNKAIKNGASGKDTSNKKEGNKMNREIKFRGKCERSDEWCYGSLVDYGYDEMPEIQGFDVFREGNDNWKEIKVIPETVGQFTGLYDKTGKGIYEADRILININHYVVIFYKGMFAIEVEGCGYIPLRNVSTVCKVIGNVFDNPELLKVK